MVVDNADGVDSASSWAWILAGAPDTSLTDWTITAEDTLRPAGDIWITYIVPLA